MSWIRAIGTGGGSPTPVIPYPVEFDYTGDIQEYIVPYTGLYKLEVWGAQGSYDTSGVTDKSYGGYSIGYKVLNQHEKIYICIGGCPGNARDTVHIGGYNGGGNGIDGSAYLGGGGGGATHMAYVTGTLSTLGYANFVTAKQGLIIAGGGGGTLYNSSRYGGVGGGTSGGNGTQGSNIGTGGTQTAAGSTATGGGTGSFGKGGDSSSSQGGAGGGGGLYGGGAGGNAGPGGGGSGYIGSVPQIIYNGVTYSPSTVQGARVGNGFAKISCETIDPEPVKTYIYKDGVINNAVAGNLAYKSGTASLDSSYAWIKYNTTSIEIQTNIHTGVTNFLIGLYHTNFIDASKYKKIKVKLNITSNAGSGGISLGYTTSDIEASSVSGYSNTRFNNMTYVSTTAETGNTILEADISEVTGNIKVVYTSSSALGGEGKKAATISEIWLES